MAWPYSLDMGIYVNWTDAANNRSRVTWYVNVYGENVYYTDYVTRGSITIQCRTSGAYFLHDNGTNLGTAWTAWSTNNGRTSMSGPNSWNTIASGSLWLYHGTNGYVEMLASGNFESDGYYGTPYMEDGGWWQTPTNGGGLTDFVRLPTTPSYSSGPTRTIRTVDVTLSAVTNYGSSLNYYVDYSQNGGGYTGGQSSTGRSFSFPNLTLGSSYVFRGYAADSEGTGGNVTSTVNIPNVPSAPSTCTSSAASGRQVTVTSGNALANGATITGYYAQQSPDNGVTWQNAAGTVGGSDLMTNQAITYSGLIGGATYKFRAFAANEMGSGATTTSSSVFVPSGGKRFNGTSFINASKANRRNAANTAWVPLTKTKKYVNGAWTDFV